MCGLIRVPQRPQVIWYLSSFEDPERLCVSVHVCAIVYAWDRTIWLSVLTICGLANMPYNVCNHAFSYEIQRKTTVAKNAFNSI